VTDLHAPTGRAEADVAVVDSAVITLDANLPRTTAVAIRAGRIAALGEAATRLIGRDTEVIRGPGKAVLPGFVDTHSHMFFGGVVAESVDLAAASSIADVVDALRERARTSEAGTWIRGTGFSLERLRERRHPRSEELDRASRRHPIWISSDSFHSSATNSLGFEEIRIPEVISGQERDAAGQRTGVFLTDACNLEARRRAFAFITDGEAQSMIRRVADEAAANGITTIHAFEGSRLPHSRDFDALMAVKDSLPVHVLPFLETFDVSRAKERGAVGVGGCGRCNLDGMPNVHTAALTEPYADVPEARGELHYEQREIDQFILDAHRQEMVVGMHAMGDAAIEQLLTSFEAAQARIPHRPLRGRIEHFHIPTSDHISRAGRLKLVLALQPIMSHLWGEARGVFRSRLGEDRVRRIDRLRDLLRAGAIATTGADQPLHPYAPFLWVQLMARHPFDSSQSLSVEEALKVAMTNGAIAGGEEGRRGTLEAGKAADLILIDRDPLASSIEELASIRIVRTFVGGKTVYPR